MDTYLFNKQFFLKLTYFNTKNYGAKIIDRIVIDG